MKDLKNYCKNDYYFNNFKQEKLKELQEYLKNREQELELLKTVKIVTKKDGSEFQNFTKNFELDGKIFIRGYPFDNYIQISKYPIEIDINRYSMNKDFLEKIEKTDPSRIVKGYCIKDHVYFNVKEFYNEIQKEIDRRELAIKNTKESIKNFDKNMNKLEKIIDKLVLELSQFDNENKRYTSDFSDCKYILEKTIHHFYK